MTFPFVSSWQVERDRRSLAAGEEPRYIRASAAYRLAHMAAVKRAERAAANWKHACHRFTTEAIDRIARDAAEAAYQEELHR